MGGEEGFTVMQVSLNWLKEYVPIDLDPKDLADLLTMSGSEIDSITELGKEFEGVVVGHITAVNPHPNADKLSLCTVDTGSATCSIVCGAQNMKPGDKAPLALSGATLPSGITIKKAKIRGEASEGMLCSEVELALGNDRSGIMILSPDTTVGQPLAEALELKDVVFEIGLTPNRPDCLSLIGLAREISALTGKPLHLPSINMEELGEDISTLTSVTIEDPDLCPRYCARIISGVTIGPSPLWMRRRLEACGMRAINNVVDVTNYVLLEMGQPLHAFDLTLLDQEKIVVKRAITGSPFITLDDKEHKLPEDALTICDGSKPIALAGIMGGLNTEVKETTAKVLLESAYFAPTGILRTSKKMGIRTESSQRFEKGVDPEGVPRALNRAAELIAELAGGTINPGCIDNCPKPVPAPPTISLSTGRTNSILGTELTSNDISQTLRNLGFTAHENGDSITATPPSFRVDIKESVDLIEEVARLRGYDKIPATLPHAISQPPKKDPAVLLEKKTKETLVQHGYREIITYSFISPLDLQHLELRAEDQRLQPLTIINPLSEDQSSMRTSLLPGLLSTARKNIFQKNSNLKLFEVGPVFFRRENERLPRETKLVAGLTTGLHQEKSWNSDGRTVDFFDLKGCVETLLSRLRIRNVSFLPPAGNPFLNTGNALDLMVGEQNAGFVGEILPQVLDRFQLSQQVYVFEIFLSRLLPEFSELQTFHPLPKYPPVFRDLALVIDDTIPAQTVSDTIDKFKNKYIEEIEVFDYYKGKSLAPGKKSLAYRLKYQAYDHTLTDREVNTLQEKLINTLNQELGAVLRE